MSVHVHEEPFPVAPAELFALLHTPSAIRVWWSAASAIVMPEVGGLWAATWGADQVEPHAEGALLRVTQAGFPETAAGAQFRAGCVEGWTHTFAGIRALLAARSG